VAVMHGVSPLLARTLRWRGPEIWARFLDEQRSHTAVRHARIDALLAAIDRGARERGIAAIALKGVALYSLGIYEVGDRPMADVDLLVRPADAQSAAGMLADLGYVETIRTWKERIFSPRDGRPPARLGEHSASNIKIDLHERICERMPWTLTEVSESIFPARPLPGLNAYASTMGFMIHLLLHAAGNMPTRELRLLHLHDIAQLSHRMTSSDWDGMLDHARNGQQLWWAYPPLELTARYYPAAIPQRILDFFESQCPRVLSRVSRRRSLYDVSYSYLWIEAFPGIAWTQSIPELARYAASRVRPSREHLTLRGQIAEAESWISQDPWARLSQGRRVLRWMTSRPARVSTMYAIHAALAQAQ
jgi:Uncharacterised nucleotidyltransferase